MLDQLDHAAGVMLLVDPAHVTGSKADIDSTVESDFGILQAVTRLRMWAGGADVPVVLVLTKVDETRKLLEDHGGTEAFCRKFFPKLIATVRNLKVCKISAVQTTNERKSEIKPDFVPRNLEIPLRYCLDKISEVEENAEVAKRREENIRKIKREIKRDKIIGWCIAAVIAIALGILAYYVLTIIWPDILDRWILGY